LTEFECSKQFLYTLYSRFLKEDDLYKEIMMLKYISAKLEEKVKSSCLKIFYEFGFSEKYSTPYFFNSGGTNLSENASTALLDMISNSIIDSESTKTKGKLKKVKTLVR